MSAAPFSITIEPIVSYPREAEAGRTYLMTIDLRFPVDKEPWPYNEEEHEIYCLIDSAPFFDNEELNEGVIVLHRFGGTYGPAMFLLTANDLDMEEPVGVIKLTLTNRQLMPLQVFKLDKIRISRKSIPPLSTVNIRKETPTESSNAFTEAPDEVGGWTDLPEETPSRGADSPFAPPVRLPREIKLLRTLRPPGPNFLVAMAWSPDGGEAIALLGSDSVLLIDAAGKMRLLAGLPTSGDSRDLPERLVWSSDGKLAVAHSRTISFFEMETGSLLLKTDAYSSNITDIQWSPNGRQLGVVTETGVIDLLAPWGDATESLRKQGSPVLCLAWRLQGDYLVVGHDNGELGLWSTRRSVQRRQQSNRRPAAPREEESGWAPSPRVYAGHKARVNCVAWSPRGVYFASGSDDNAVRLWRVDEPADEFQLVFEGHTSGVTKVSFSADGELLASLAQDGTARLWRLPQGHCVAIIDVTDATTSEPPLPPSILSFHPQKPVLALCLESESAISTLELDVPALRNRTTPSEAAGARLKRVSIVHDTSAEADAALAQEISSFLNIPDSGVFVQRGTGLRSDYLIVLLSAQSVRSDGFRQEVNRSLEYRKSFGHPKILPVRVAYHDPLPPPLDDQLNGIQWARWETPSDTPGLVEELGRAISGSDLRNTDTNTGDHPRVRVFFAYKRNVEPDEPITREIAAALSRKHDVFIDENIPVGVDWANTINEAFGQARVLIVMLTASSLKSRAVNSYLQRAAQRQDNLRILPVRLACDDALPEELSFMNGMRQIVWRNREDTPRVIEELTSIIEAPDPYGNERPPLGVVVPPNSAFYIPRLADKRVEEMIRRGGVTISIVGPHQVGKTSLLTRIGHTAQEQGQRLVRLDLGSFGDTLSFEDFLHEFCRVIAEGTGQIELFEKNWTATSPGWRTDFMVCTDLLQGILEQSTATIVLLADELDRLRKYTFYPRFIALLQTWHERQGSVSSWKNLSMVFTFASRAAAAVGDKAAPLGKVIEPEDFIPEETEQLNHSHGDPLNSTEVRQLHELVRGHPYLTQHALYWLKTGRSSLDELLANASNLEGPFGEHLGQLHAAVFGGEGQDPKIMRDALYELLIGPGRLEPAALDRLERLGLVRMRGGSAEARCRLYEEFFYKGLQA